jgi:hypothetical protein
MSKIPVEMNLLIADLLQQGFDQSVIEELLTSYKNSDNNKEEVNMNINDYTDECGNIGLTPSQVEQLKRETCDHEWLEFVGLFTSDVFCNKCNEKK